MNNVINFRATHFMRLFFPLDIQFWLIRLFFFCCANVRVCMCVWFRLKNNYSTLSKSKQQYFGKVFGDSVECWWFTFKRNFIKQQERISISDQSSKIVNLQAHEKKKESKKTWTFSFGLVVLRRIESSSLLHMWRVFHLNRKALEMNKKSEEIQLLILFFVG